VLAIQVVGMQRCSSVPPLEGETGGRMGFIGRLMRKSVSWPETNPPAPHAKRSSTSTERLSRTQSAAAADDSRRLEATTSVDASGSLAHSLKAGDLSREAETHCAWARQNGLRRDSSFTSNFHRVSSGASTGDDTALAFRRLRSDPLHNTKPGPPRDPIRSNFRRLSPGDSTATCASADTRSKFSFTPPPALPTPTFRLPFSRLVGRCFSKAHKALEPTTTPEPTNSGSGVVGSGVAVGSNAKAREEPSGDMLKGHPPTAFAFRRLRSAPLHDTKPGPPRDPIRPTPVRKGRDRQQGGDRSPLRPEADGPASGPSVKAGDLSREAETQGAHNLATQAATWLHSAHAHGRAPPCDTTSQRKDDRLQEEDRSPTRPEDGWATLPIRRAVSYERGTPTSLIRNSDTLSLTLDERKEEEERVRRSFLLRKKMVALPKF